MINILTKKIMGMNTDLVKQKGAVNSLHFQSLISLKEQNLKCLEND